ncbi:MAG: hypothetical protein GC134_08065 [Proteobacteria bacterium]|nr:hypothetical protein [Pseudomonadota bacterium]
MKKLIPACLLALTIALPARAYEPDATALADISAVEKYLNRLDSFKAGFEQFVPGAPFSEGMFYLKRPGKFLWQYTKPTSHKLITSGGLIYYEDGETGQVTQVPRGGLSDLLGKKQIHLMSGDIKVIDHQRDEDTIGITVELDESTADDDFDSSNRVQFIFSQKPFQLKQLVTSNQLGQDVVVSFHDIQENPKLGDKIFAYTPPHYDEGF